MSLLQRIKKHDWYQKGFEGSAFALYQWQSLLIYQKLNKFPVAFRELLTITHGGRTEWFYNLRDLLRIRRWMIRNISRNEKFAADLVKRWRKELVAWTDFRRNLEKLDLRMLTASELLTNFHKAREVCEPSVALAFLNEGFSLMAEQWLGDMLRKFLRKTGREAKFSEYFSLLTRTTHPSFVQEAVAAKRAGKNSRELARDYYWIHFNYLHTNPLPPSFFAKWKPEPPPNFSQIIRQKRKLMQKIKLSSQLKRLFAAVDLFTWWQDQRKKNALLYTYWIYQFLFEAGRRHGINREFLLRSVPPELEKILKGDKRFIRKLKSRGDPFLVYIDERLQPIIQSGHRAKQCLDAILKMQNRGEIKGMAAYLGVVSGRVVRLLTAADMKRVRHGDILVTSMTRPEHTPVLHKAGAIVTDEGGVTSHAAIVSREFKKPCIIGTHVATKVLKDGDLVEVDANKGVVRKLTK